MSLRIPTRRVNQNNQGFLLGIFKMSDLRKFVRFTQRIVLDYDDETNKPIYNDEVQRKVSPSKIDSIADFLIHDTDAFFPTNIVVSIPSISIDSIEDDQENSAVVVLKDFVEQETGRNNGDTYLTIIDGQHRIAGIEKAIARINSDIQNLQLRLRMSKDPKPDLTDEIAKNYALLKRLENFEIVVTFFIDPMPEYQAMVFSTINRTQTKVSEDLVFSLFGLSKNDSPQKTALEVVLALNASDKSPLFNRIKLAGAKYKILPPLSQSAAVKSILYQISLNLKQAEIEKNKPRDFVADHPNSALVFRKYYGANQDEKIVKIINNYFKAVRDVFVDENENSYWSLDSEFNLLHTTVGYQALFLVLIDLLRITPEENRYDYNYFKDKLSLASDLDILDQNVPKKYPLTSKSIGLVYNYIGERILGNFFNPKD